MSGWLLGSVNTTGIYILAVMTIPVLIFIFYAMRQAYPVTTQPLAGVPALTAIDLPATRWGAIALLAIIIGLRSWSVIGTVSFLPKMFQDMGWAPFAYGSITGTYWMSSAIFGVLAGNWADRWGRRQVTSVALVAGGTALFFLPLYNNWVAFPLAILAGGLLGASHSIFVVIAQSILPGVRRLHRALRWAIYLAPALWPCGASAGWPKRGVSIR